MTEAVLVSGGSGAIGAATARLLARRGFHPVIGYGGNAAAAKALADELAGTALALDLCDDSAIDSAAETLCCLGRPLAAVILAASPPPRQAPFAAIEPADAARQWRVNVEGPRRLLSRVIPACFRPRKRGVVVAVLSDAMGEEQARLDRMADYIIAKHGLKGLMAALRAEYRWLKVAAVSPGFTETPMLAAFDPRLLEIARAQTPFAQPDDVAALIVDEVTG